MSEDNHADNDMADGQMFIFRTISQPQASSADIPAADIPAADIPAADIPAARRGLFINYAFNDPHGILGNSLLSSPNRTL